MSLHANYEDFTAGEQGKTNWPNLPEAKDRRPVSFVAIDVNGVTVAKATSWKAAQEVASMYPGCRLRPVYITEKNLRQEDEKRRARRWEEQLYKPLPVRSLKTR